MEQNLIDLFVSLTILLSHYYRVLYFITILLIEWDGPLSPVLVRPCLQCSAVSSLASAWKLQFAFVSRVTLESTPSSTMPNSEEMKSESSLTFNFRYEVFSSSVHTSVDSGAVGHAKQFERINSIISILTVVIHAACIGQEDERREDERRALVASPDN